MNIRHLREQITSAFSEKWQINDEAHRAEHFEDVFSCAEYISDTLGLGYDRKLMLFAAYFHDLFAWSRINHHQLSHQWILTTDHPVVAEHLNMKERLMVAQACLEHRASYREQFSSEFAELINSADRGRPGDVMGMLERAMLYRAGHYPHEKVYELRAESVKHLKEKFGHGGYARYPELYLKCFAEELQQQRDEIASL